MEKENENSALDATHGTYKAYLIGFILSLALTLTSYFLVTDKILAGATLGYTLLGLGTVQMIVQMICFLHLGQESKPHWNSITFLFMLMVLVIIVAGSLWIMSNLNYNVMAPSMDLHTQKVL